MPPERTRPEPPASSALRAGRARHHALERLVRDDHRIPPRHGLGAGGEAGIRHHDTLGAVVLLAGTQRRERILGRLLVGLAERAAADAVVAGALEAAVALRADL